MRVGAIGLVVVAKPPTKTIRIRELRMTGENLGKGLGGKSIPPSPPDLRTVARNLGES